MEFGLNDEQEMLRATARAFVQRNCPPELAKTWDDDATPPELFTAHRGCGVVTAFRSPRSTAAPGRPHRARGRRRGARPGQPRRGDVLLGPAHPRAHDVRVGRRRAAPDLVPEVVAGGRNSPVAISEPDAGSDAAALRTTAAEHGDHFVVNGQKMWCTGAGLPDTTIVMYVRTDPDAPKHGGISALLVDRERAGVELRRIPTLARHILGTYEVFFDDVVVPRGRLVGPLHDGWQVMLSNLELERS